MARSLGIRLRILIVATLAGSGLGLAMAGGALATVAPTLTLSIRTATDNNTTQIPYGISFFDHIVVTGASGTPTGKVRFNQFANGTCSGTPGISKTSTLAFGQANSYTLTQQPGTGSFRARYLGDATYTATSGPCQAYVVTKGHPTVATTVRNAAGKATTTVLIGALAHDSVTISAPGVGTPSGTVKIQFFTDSVCANLAATSSAATLSTTGTADVTSFARTANHPTGLAFRAVYSGDAYYTARTGACEPFSVKAPPKVATQVRNPDGQATGATPWNVPLHDTVTVTGGWGTPTGTVVVGLFDNGTCTGTATRVSSPIALVNGFANVTGLTSAGLAPGLHAFRAAYSGNATYAGRTGACEAIIIVGAPATIQATIRDATGRTVSSVPVGTVVHVHAVVSGPAGTPTGTVTAVTLAPGCTGLGVAGSATLSGGAADITARSATATTVGTNIAFSVGYSGDATYAKATPICVEVAVTAASSTSAPGQTAVPAPPATAAPDASAGPSESAGQSAGAAASEEPSSLSSPATALASPAPAATSAPTASTTNATSDPTVLAVIVLLIALVLVGVFLLVGRRKPPAAAP